jgi:hypothetical protein
MTQNEIFNAAINFAIGQGSEASKFLRAWREGDTSEWPDFEFVTVATPSASPWRNAVLNEASDRCLSIGENDDPRKSVRRLIERVLLQQWR